MGGSVKGTMKSSRLEDAGTVGVWRPGGGADAVPYGTVLPVIELINGIERILELCVRIVGLVGGFVVGIGDVVKVA